MIFKLALEYVSNNVLIQKQLELEMESLHFSPETRQKTAQD